MRWLRILLLILTAGALAFVAYGMYDEYHRYGRLIEPWLITVGVPAFLALNLAYLWQSSSHSANGRIARIISLWLDAKENEFKKRADKSIG